MPELNFNFESKIKKNVLESAPLREDIITTQAQLVDHNKGNEELDSIQDIMNEDQLEGKEINLVDYEEGDLDKLAAAGFKHGGEHTYLISPIGEQNWKTDKLFSCVAVIGIGRDATTGKEVSFLSHQHPDRLVNEDNEKVETFSRELSASLKELRERSQPETIEVLLVGGNFNKKSTRNDYTHDHYRQSIKGLEKIVNDTMGFEPKVLAGPNNHVGSDTNITIETQKRRVWIERDKQPPLFDQSFQANMIDEMEKEWLKE